MTSAALAHSVAQGVPADGNTLAHRLRSAQLFSDSHPGSSRTGRLQYAFDDHRDAHVEVLDAEFSRTIIGQLLELVRSAARPSYTQV
jgi:hypothetical protein